jgi:hypothetical protein
MAQHSSSKLKHCQQLGKEQQQYQGQQKFSHFKAHANEMEEISLSRHLIKSVHGRNG